jgi:hypothetical protein
VAKILKFDPSQRGKRVSDTVPDHFVHGCALRTFGYAPEKKKAAQLVIIA